MTCFSLLQDNFSTCLRVWKSSSSWIAQHLNFTHNNQSAASLYRIKPHPCSFSLLFDNLCDACHSRTFYLCSYLSGFVLCEAVAVFAVCAFSFSPNLCECLVSSGEAESRWMHSGFGQTHSDQLRDTSAKCSADKVWLDDVGGDLFMDFVGVFFVQFYRICELLLKWKSVNKAAAHKF